VLQCPFNRKYHNNQIQCKHFDFVLCDKAFLKPALILELDDSSHDKFNRQESDEFKQQVCEMVGLPLVRVKVQQSYSSDEIDQLIRGEIQEGGQSAQQWHTAIYVVWRLTRYPGQPGIRENSSAC